MRPWTDLKSSTLGSLALAAVLALSTAASAEGADRFQPAAPEPGQTFRLHDQVRHASLRRQYLLHHRHEEGLVRRGRHQIRAGALWTEGERFQCHHAAPQRSTRHHLGILPADAADLQGRRQAEMYRLHR